MSSFVPLPIDRECSEVDETSVDDMSNHYQMKAMQAKRVLTLALLLKGENQDATLSRLESKAKKLSLELVRVRRVARTNMLRPVSCLLLGEASFLPAQTVIEELEYMITSALQMVSTYFFVCLFTNNSTIIYIYVLLLLLLTLIIIHIIIQ